MALNFGYRIGDLTETTTAASGDDIELSLAGSLGSRKITAGNFGASERQRANIFYATDFGANLTRLDNQVPINAAITAASAAGGGIVGLPVGTIKISGTINLKSSVTLIGQGPARSIIQDPAVTPTFIPVSAQTLSNVVLRDFSVSVGTLAYSDTSVLSLYCGNVAGLTIDNVQVQGLMARVDGCTDVDIDRAVSLSSNYSNFYLVGCTRIRVQRSRVTKGGDGFQIKGCTDAQLVNNFARDCWINAIRVEDSYQVLVRGNTCVLCQYGITVYGPQSQGFTGYTVDVVVAFNIFDRCFKVETTTPFTALLQGFVMGTKIYVDRVLFIGNQVIGQAGASTLVSDFSSNTTINASFANSSAIQAILGASQYNLNHTSGSRIYTSDTSQNYSAGWFVYVNVPAGIDLTVDPHLTVDLYWSGPSMADNVMGVRYYSAVDRGGAVLGTSDLYNSGVQFNCLPVFTTAPNAAGMNSVKCIEFYLQAPVTGVAFWVLSELRHGLEARIAYAHCYLIADQATLDVQLYDNRCTNVTYPQPTLFNYPQSITHNRGNSWDFVTVAWNPPSLAAGATQSTQATLYGAQIGDRVLVSFDQHLLGTYLWGEVSSPDSITIYQQNPGASTQDVAAGTLTIRLERR